MPSIGDLVIFGEADAPQAHCIGRIVRRDGKMWYGEYLSKRTQDRYKGDLCDTFVTPISDFGVSVKTEGKTLIVDRVERSTATYLDGKPRYWQEALPVSIETA